MNEPAFPQAYDRYGKNLPGMDLRDAFAMAAIPAVWGDGSRYGLGGIRECVECAYAVADAMMAERLKGAGE